MKNYKSTKTKRSIASCVLWLLIATHSMTGVIVSATDAFALWNEDLMPQDNPFISDKLNVANATKKASLAPKDLTSIDSYTLLAKEKSNSEGELAIILGEVEEYQTLMSRFPTLNNSLKILFEEAKDRSAKHLGKINALSKVIELSRSEHTLC